MKNDMQRGNLVPLKDMETDNFKKDMKLENNITHFFASKENGEH